MTTFRTQSDLVENHDRLSEEGPLGPKDIKKGMKLGSHPWVVLDATPKRVTVASGSGVDPGSKFAGKRYTFVWDGTGYKRQGQYLHADGIYAIKKEEAMVDRSNPMGDHGYLHRIIEENDRETRRNPISEFKILAGTRSALPGLFEGQFIVKGDSRKIGPGNFKGWARDFGDQNQGVLVDAPDADAAIKKVCDKKRLNPFYVTAVPADTKSAAKALKLESSKSLQEATDDDVMDAEEEVGDLLGQFDRCKDPQRKAAMLKQAWALMKKSGLDKDRDWMKQYKMRAGRDEEQHTPYKPSGSWAQQHDAEQARKQAQAAHRSSMSHAFAHPVAPKKGSSLVKRHESKSYLRRSGTAVEESDYDIYRDQKPFVIQIQPPGEKSFTGMSMPGTQGRMTAGDRSLEGAKKMIATFQKMDAKDKYYAGKKEFPKYRIVKDGKPVYTTD